MIYITPLSIYILIREIAGDKIPPCWRWWWWHDEYDDEDDDAYDDEDDGEYDDEYDGEYDDEDYGDRHDDDKHNDFDDDSRSVTQSGQAQAHLPFPQLVPLHGHHHHFNRSDIHYNDHHF